MAGIGGGPPSTIWMRILMPCTWTIQTINMTNGQKIKIGRYNTTKTSGPSLQGIVENQI